MNNPHLRTGLGLRRGLLPELLTMPQGAVDFLECAPENWIGVGSSHGRSLAQLAERFAISCHGLSLSLGGIAPLDHKLLTSTRQFLDRFQVQLYSEHLSYCSDDGHLYDLLPIPFTDEAVRHVAARIRQVQDQLGRRIAVENISYYAAPYQAMSELAFIRAVLGEADCDLLLDINNVYVNACNHRYDPLEFVQGLPRERVTAMHIAGHYDEAPDLKVDTHGAPVQEHVWDLYAAACERFGVQPTVLERDFNYPPLAELLAETARIALAQQASVRHAA
ncbi:HvfB family MNIO-type RiPP peptide maturase [Pseudomonas shirazensis]|uniref:HvfB family MNIO-type RiPP peptide maturase n=1 Tax=Pseudomonas shirazensis TaxID=2745494 RepID=UPI003D2BDFCE